MNSSVKSQLEHTNLCGSNRSTQRRLHWRRRQRWNLSGNTGSHGYWYSSI